MRLAKAAGKQTQAWVEQTRKATHLNERKRHLEGAAWEGEEVGCNLVMEGACSKEEPQDKPQVQWE